MKRIYTILFALLAVITAGAQEISLQVAREVAEGQKFQLTIRMENFQAEPPQSISLPNCTLLYGPAMGSGSSFTSINGKTTSSTFINATYTFRADKVSTIDIPAITVTDSKGKKYSTKPTKLTIVPAGQRPQNGMPYDRNNLPDQGRVNPDGHFSADDMFVRISVDKNHVYLQEPVVATIKLYTRMNIRSFQMLTQPTFEGFLSEELDLKEERGEETVNGKEYVTLVLKRCVLYPQKTGQLSLSSGTYEVVLVDRVNVNSGGFIPDFRLVEKQVRTTENVAKINVQPLPEPAPASFDGAVGSFTADVELSSTKLLTNEPATYTYTVSGTGNIKYLKEPTVNMPPGMDLYTPKTTIDAHYAHGNITGTYSVSYTLLPQEVGNFVIPALEFTYFDPRDAQYHTIDLDSYNVSVAKGANSVVSEQNVISRGMTDILHIKTGGYDLSKSVDYTYRSLRYWALYILLTVAFVTVVIVYRRQLKLNADVRGRRLARALRSAMKKFKRARSAMADHDSDRFYAELTKAIWGYLSDKLGIPASQLVRDNIASQLADYGVDPEGIDNVITILDECEMARFTPMHSDADMAALYDKVVNAVKSIENVKK